MKWEDVRQAFPGKWVLIEAIEAFTNEESERILVDIVPLKSSQILQRQREHIKNFIEKILLTNFMSFILIEINQILLKKMGRG